MAFCSKCGAQVPDGAAFCDSCGARLEAGPQPAPGYLGYDTAPAPKKRKTGLVIALAALLVVGIVIGVLFLTGVLGSGAKGVEGTWTLTQTEGDGRQATLVLVLEKDGGGYAYRESKGERTYFPITWDDVTIYDGDSPASYTWEGDTLTVAAAEDTLVFTRAADDDSAGSSTLLPGTYRLTAIYEDGEDISYEIEENYGWVLMELRETHNGAIYYGGMDEEIPDWDRHFIKLDGRLWFYRCDGSQFTLYYWGEEWIFIREG
jgi:hypothetical protein